jgi:hypothetical protein
MRRRLAPGCAIMLSPKPATPLSLPLTPRPGVARSASSHPPPTASRASFARQCMPTRTSALRPFMPG